MSIREFFQSIREFFLKISSPRLFHDASLSSGTAENRAVSQALESSVKNKNLAKLFQMIYCTFYKLMTLIIHTEHCIHHTLNFVIND